MKMFYLMKILSNKIGMLDKAEKWHTILLKQLNYFKSFLTVFESFNNIIDSIKSIEIIEIFNNWNSFH